jgi:hypothetical protein
MTDLQSVELSDVNTEEDDVYNTPKKSSCTDSCTPSLENCFKAVPIDPELVRVTDAWPHLAAHLKAAILALIDSSVRVFS